MQYIFIGKKLEIDANTLFITFIHLICNSILGNKCACHPQHYASLSVEQEIISKKLESRRAKDRERYANMTLEQRQAIRDRQNARNATTDQIETRRARQRARYANMTSEQKHAKRDREYARREFRCNTLGPKSSAMENPLYNPSDYLYD